MTLDEMAQRTLEGSVSWVALEELEGVDVEYARLVNESLFTPTPLSTVETPTVDEVYAEYVSAHFWHSPAGQRVAVTALIDAGVELIRRFWSVAVTSQLGYWSKLVTVADAEHMTTQASKIYDSLEPIPKTLLREFCLEMCRFDLGEDFPFKDDMSKKSLGFLNRLAAEEPAVVAR